MTWNIYAHEISSPGLDNHSNVKLGESTSTRLGRALRQAAKLAEGYQNVAVYVAESSDATKHERHYLPAPRTPEQDQAANRAQLDPRVGHRKRRTEVQR